jgi:hypothetical protein
MEFTVHPFIQRRKRLHTALTRTVPGPSADLLVVLHQTNRAMFLAELQAKRFLPRSIVRTKHDILHLQAAQLMGIPEMVIQKGPHRAKPKYALSERGHQVCNTVDFSKVDFNARRALEIDGDGRTQICMAIDATTRKEASSQRGTLLFHGPLASIKNNLKERYGDVLTPAEVSCALGYPDVSNLLLALKRKHIEIRTLTTSSKRWICSVDDVAYLMVNLQESGKSQEK